MLLKIYIVHTELFTNVYDVFFSGVVAG